MTGVLQLSILMAVFAVVLSSPEISNAQGSDLSPRTVYACEGQEVKIECAKGLTIQVMRSNYGRLTLSICNEGRSTEGWRTDCLSSRTYGIVSNLCNNKSICSTTATNALFGDTCAATYKYLEIEYTCHKGGTSIPVTYPPETQRLTRTRHPSSLPSVESTEGRRSQFPLVPTTSTDSYFPGDMEGDLWCVERSVRNISWPKARPGQTVLMNCPNSPKDKSASWKCGQVPVEWIDLPDLSQCTSHPVKGILVMVNVNEKRFKKDVVELIFGDLLTYTEPQEPVFGGDLLNILNAMHKVTIQIENQLKEGNPEISRDLLFKVNQAVINTSSNLLTESRVEAWYDIPESTRADIATTLLSAVEKSAYLFASVTNRPAQFINIMPNLVVEVRVVDIIEPVDDQLFPQKDAVLPSPFDVASGGNFIELNRKTVQHFGVSGLSKMVFAAFNNLDKWLKMDDSIQEIQHQTAFTLRLINSSEDNIDNYTKQHRVSVRNGSESENLSGKTVNTRIISASFVTREMKNVVLEEPVIFVMKHLKEENALHPSCVFWDYSDISMKGRWSTYGCILVETNATHTQCSCKHLTNFAVLMSVKEQKLSDIQKFSLSFITYFGCILSIICLAVAFLTFQFFKNLRCDRNTIHKNLVINLCIAEIIFLAGIIQYETPMLCAIVAGLLHYLFLVTFLWMCLEGIQLYVMLVQVFEAESSRVKWYYLSAYGIPALIVIISTIVNSGGYGTPSHCWLSTDQGFIWAFVGPVCIIICINSVMLTIAIYVMCTHTSNAVNVWKARQKTTFENMRSWIKGAIVLVVLLGLTWTFGLFYINEQSVVMAYLFTALNSTQGVFIFLFHCLMNEKVQIEYKRWVRHTKWLPEDLRVRCGGVRSSASISPIHSSSSGVNKIVQEQKKSFEYITRLFSRNAERKRSSTTTLPSSSNNNIKRDYNLICQHSDSRTGSGENDSSRVYSEPTEDPYSYMESAQLALGADEDFYLAAGDISMIEGSVADTDYLDNFTKRSSSVIDIDKYKIRNQMIANGKKNGAIPAVPLTDERCRERQNNGDKPTSKEPEQDKLLISFANVEVPSSDHSLPHQGTSLPVKM